MDIPDPGIPEVCSYGSPCFGLYRLGTTWNRLAKLPVWRLGRVGVWEEDDGFGVGLYGWFWICGVRFVEMTSLDGFRLVLDMST